MEASESQSSNNGEVKSTVVPAPTDPEDVLQNRSTSSSLEQQRSIFSLTLDEIQSRSGMSFGSMNIDEFINSVSSDDFDQVSSTVVNNQEVAANNENEMAVQTASLPARQGSFSVPNHLCDITIDEVWAEIQQNNNHADDRQENNHGQDFLSFFTSDELLPLQTLGEMTLEEFLIMVGVIRESPSTTSPLQQEVVEHLNINQSISYITNSTCLDTSISIGQVMCYEFSAPSNCVGNGNGNGNTTSISDGSSVYPMLAAALDSGGCIGEPATNNVENQLICNSPDPSDGGETSSTRKRCAPLQVDVERRTRRMIRNRESAARSRSRKQAYAEALEKELNQQREENRSLKLALEEAKSKLKQEGKEPDSLMKKKSRTLGRTLSSPW